MAGTLANARIWSLADVYVGDTDAVAPTDTTSALSGDWDLLGLIDDDGGIGSEFASEDAKHYAYGSILVRTTSVKQSHTMTVTALENSDLVFLLANPGSESESAGGVTTRTIRARNLGDALRSVVLELTDGDIVTRRYIPRAQITKAGSSTISDAEIDGTPLTIEVLAANADDDSVYFMTELTDDPGADVAAS